VYNNAVRLLLGVVQVNRCLASCVCVCVCVYVCYWQETVTDNDQSVYCAYKLSLQYNQENRCIYTVKLLTAATLGEAHDVREASPLGLLQWAVGCQQQQQQRLHITA